MTWQGVPILKAPTDLWTYQEILFETRPEFIIETGTFKGGSALYFAALCDVMGRGSVITIDINPCQISHPRVHAIVHPEGSTHPDVVAAVQQRVGKAPCMVVLDSTHRRDHVLSEIRAYSRHVPLGGYLVVEDTCLGGHPVLPSWGNGPMDAVEAFLREGTFESDPAREKFLLTLHPRGFLRRIRTEPTAQV